MSTTTIAPPERSTITARVKWDPALRSNGTRKVSGYASVFDSESEDLGFRETIAPGAFKRALAKPGADHFLLWCHDQHAVLARSSAGTLELREDAKGLRISAELVDTSLGRDVDTLVRTGHVSSMSFGFTVARDAWDTRNGVDHRRVLEIGELFEVSIVPEAAYAGTSVEGRAVSAATRRRIARVAGRNADELPPTRTLKIREPAIYGPESKFSYWRDLMVVEEARQAREAKFGTVAFQFGEQSTRDTPVHGTLADARERLDIARRDLSTTAADPFAPATGNAFVGALFASSARARAEVAAALTQGPLPKGAMLVTAPRFTTGATAAVQTSENSAVSETDPGSAQATGAVVTIAGQVDCSQQAVDQSPGGVFDQALSQELGQAIGAALDVSVITAILAAAGAGTSVSYTDTTPSAAEFFSKVCDLRQQLHVALGEPPDLIVMHPRRLAFADTSTVEPLPWRMNVLASPSIPTGLGAGTNEDRVLELASGSIELLSRPPEIRVMFEVLSGTLTVRFQAYQLTALVIRQPKAVGILTGTGLVPPAFPIT